MDAQSYKMEVEVAMKIWPEKGRKENSLDNILV